MIRLVGALLLAGVVGAPAWAQDARLELDGVEYRIPAPAGYCAEGKAVDAYLVRRHHDETFAPDVVMYPCGAETASIDAYLFATDRNADAMTRRAYLASLRPSMTEPALNIDELLDNWRRLAFGKLATVEGDLIPASADDVCGYVLSLEELTVRNKTTEVTMMGCSTVIRGRPVYVIHYRPGPDPGDYGASKSEVRRIALSIVPAIKH
jgi:hypothetical protein